MENNSDSQQETHTPETSERIPLNAILVIEGVVIHMLKEAIINIGRKLENHIAIDDPRISRQHAQLRAVNGHFVLVDLNSLGGTFVNGQRTKECVLYPGDLISLAGVTLVYSQNDPVLRSSGQVDTAPLTSSELLELDRRTTVESVKGTLAKKEVDNPQQPENTATPEERAGKYTPFEKYLRALPESQSIVIIRFEQIETILNSKLPASAYEDQRWWEHATEGNHRGARAWFAAGWRIARLDVAAHQVEFIRVR